MGFFSNLEGNLEKYIEGFFKDRFEGRLQPVEIANRLAREMYNNRKISVRDVYVPNKYIVYLNPGDYKNILSIVRDLTKEIRGHLVKIAEDRNFIMVSVPHVLFEEDSQLKKGEFRADSLFSEFREDECENLHDTLKYSGLADSISQDASLSLSEPRAYLKIADGPERGKTHTLNIWPVIIGRSESCDVVLKDSSVSRQHCQIEYRRDSFIISDLGSTNHTFVNGVQVESGTLNSGDHIKTGNTRCMFEVT